MLTTSTKTYGLAVSGLLLCTIWHFHHDIHSVAKYIVANTESTLGRKKEEATTASILEAGKNGKFIFPPDTPANFSEEQTSIFHLNSIEFHDFMGPLQRYSTKNASQQDKKLLGRLQNKQVLLMGDSTDEFVWSTMCHCAREDSSYQSNHRECFGSRKFLRTCIWKPWNLSIHFHGAEYGIHPYGNIPYGRMGPYPNCDGLNLTECLVRQWDLVSNDRFGLRQMHNGTLPQPDVVIIDIALWFWFRMQWYGASDELFYQRMPEASVMPYYIKNTTEFVRAAQRYLPGTLVWALHTAVMTGAKARVKPKRVATVNEAIRNITRNENISLVDWDAMGHMWSREAILVKDGIHPQRAFNVAVGNLYLNALAVAPGKSSQYDDLSSRHAPPSK